MHEVKAVLKKSWLVGLVLLLGAAPCLAAPVYDGLYVLDGYGGVHTVDSAPVITTGLDFGFDVARDLALTGDESGVVDGMYLLTGYGDVFSFGNAPTYLGVERPYFGWDIARDVEPAPDYTSRMNGQTGFYILDGFGGIFPVGETASYFKLYRNAQSIAAGEDRYAYWGWDVAVALEVNVDYSQSANTIRSNGYYILDKFGGVHWNIEGDGGVVATAPWAGQAQPYFGWDIARDFELTNTSKGYFLLDGYGGIHAVGDASNFAPTSGTAGTPLFGAGNDIGKDIEVVYSETGSVTGLVVLDGYGGLHEVGNVGIQTPLPPFVDGGGDPWDIARDMEISPFYSFVTDAVVTGP